MTDRPVRSRARSARSTADSARVARIFGDVLPDATRDEREPVESTASDDWLLAERPPHHR